VNEPIWLTERQILATHERQLRVFGGGRGLRDPHALSSALNRPIDRWAYEQAELPELAAAYAYGLAKNHPFVDGNKRTAFLAMAGFLLLNRVPFDPDPDNATAVMLAVASGLLDEAGLTRWIGENWPEP
jgi:death-on-curing protein